jgi:hypothetical protein
LDILIIKSNNRPHRKVVHRRKAVHHHHNSNQVLYCIHHNQVAAVEIDMMVGFVHKEQGEVAEEHHHIAKDLSA